MCVFEKVQVALIQTKLYIACYIRREKALNEKNIKSLKAAKKQIESLLQSYAKAG